MGHTTGWVKASYLDVHQSSMDLTHWCEVPIPTIKKKRDLFRTVAELQICLQPGVLACFSRKIGCCLAKTTGGFTPNSWGSPPASGRTSSQTPTKPERASGERSRLLDRNPSKPIQNHPNSILLVVSQIHKFICYFFFKQHLLTNVCQGFTWVHSNKARNRPTRYFNTENMCLWFPAGCNQTSNVGVNQEWSSRKPAKKDEFPICLGFFHHVTSDSNKLEENKLEEISNFNQLS
jgi:hypothetical protein